MSSTEVVKTKRRHNAVIALEILLAGFPLKFKDDYTEYYYQDGILGVRTYKYTLGSEDPGAEEVLVSVDLSLEDFIKKCEEISFEELFSQSSSMVLTLFNRRKRQVKANP
jgi:hypothetical protein